MLADRDAAADHGDVAVERALERRRGSRRGRRATISAPRQLGAGALDQGGDRVGVGVADRARAQRLAGLLQLVAGGQHGDPRARARRRPRRARPRRARPSSAGPSSAPGCEHRLAGARCPRRRGGCRGRARPRPGPRPSRRRASVSSTRTTASAPSGTIAPVEIAIASPAPTLAAAGWPARDSPTTRSAPARRGGAGGVGGADRVAVHRRVVEAGHGVGGGDVLGEHPAERLAERRPARRRAARTRSSTSRARLVDLDQLGGHRLGSEANPLRDWVCEARR